MWSQYDIIWHWIEWIAFSTKMQFHWRCIRLCCNYLIMTHTNLNHHSYHKSSEWAIKVKIDNFINKIIFSFNTTLLFSRWLLRLLSFYILTTWMLWCCRNTTTEFLCVYLLGPWKCSCKIWIQRCVFVLNEK